MEIFMKDKQDVLNRKEFIENICKVIDAISQSKKGCCFAINGAWGSGKSFVLKRIEEQLRAIQLEETNTERYLVFHYDCWKYDYYEEPIIAIIAAMLDVTEKEIDLLPKNIRDSISLSWNTVKATLMEILKELCKNKIGINLVEVAQNVLNQADTDREIPFDELYGFKKALEKTREGIRKIAEEKTVIIVVDELDRCLPIYTIKVLERLHHIFADIENVIVIIAMDKKQVEHIVGRIYGTDDIDTDRYLRKFISFEFSLEKGKATDYFDKYKSYAALFNVNENEQHEIDKFFSDITTGIDIRTQEKIFNKAETMYILVNDNLIVDSSIMVFEILLLVLFEKQKNINLEWILNKGHFINVEQQLGSDYYIMIRKYENSIHNGFYHNVGIGDLIEIKQTAIGRAFFLLSCITYRYDNGKSGNYHYKENIEKLVELANKLKTLLCI